MSTKNVVSIKIPKEKVDEVLTHLNSIQAILGEYLIALTPQQRQAIPKVSDKTIPFVDKALEYSKTNPEFVPPFLNVTEFEVDKQAMTDLKEMFNPIALLYTNLNDTILLTGSEAYQASLTYYNSVQQAAKINIPNAKVIADDLGKRFVKASKKEEKII